MATTLLVIAAAAFLAFELAEHVVIPIVAWRSGRNRPRLSGTEAMIGKIAEVREWGNGEGHVFVAGALWKATSEAALSRGDRAAVRAVTGLVLEVAPLEDPPGEETAATEGKSHLPPAR